MDIVNNKEDKATYDLFKKDLHRFGDTFSLGSSVCSGILILDNGEKKENRSGVCHGWVRDHATRNKITYIATSLRYYRPRDTEYTYYGHIDNSVEITPEVQKRYFNDLLACESFRSCWEESVLIPGINEKEDFLLIKVTDKNVAYLATFLVLTRHPYEQKVVNIKSNPSIKSTLGLFSAWYWLCYKDDMLLEELIPLMTTSAIKGKDLYTNNYPHSHCAIDGVISTLYPVSSRDSFGFSRSNFSFLPRKDIENGLKTKRGEDLFGYFKNKMLYHGLNGRKGEEGGGGGSMDQSVLIGPISEMKELIRTFNYNVYGKKV